MMEEPSSPGKIIAGIGLPASGKSSIFKWIGSNLNIQVFLEPEEDEWPEAVSKRDVVGHFTALTWFRSARVPKLYCAAKLREEGKIVLIDSYYDKLIIDYIGRPGMEWLFSPEDPYFDVAKRLAKLDKAHLPDVDCLVCFEVSKNEWDKMREKRQRDLDKTEGFADSYETQEYFIESAKAYCNHKDIPIVRFQNKMVSIEESSNELIATLRTEGIL